MAFKMPLKRGWKLSEDDRLLWRMLFLQMVASYLQRARKVL